MLVASPSAANVQNLGITKARAICIPWLTSNVQITKYGRSSEVIPLLNPVTQTKHEISLRGAIKNGKSWDLVAIWGGGLNESEVFIKKIPTQ